MSKPSNSSPYSRVVVGMANRLAIGFDEANALAKSLHQSAPATDVDEPLDSLELLVAISLNGQVRGVTGDERFKKLKFLLRNNSPRAVRMANSWVDQQLNFDELLAAI